MEKHVLNEASKIAIKLLEKHGSFVGSSLSKRKDALRVLNVQQK